MIKRRLFAICGLAIASLLFLPLTSCSTIPDSDSKMVVSVKDQTMLLTQNGAPVRAYKISTSKYGLGDIHRSCRTPLGKMQVARKIGEGAPAGTVFKSRRRTGEVIKPDAPGRDPIVTRIMWLQGLEKCNRHAYERYIYIHGTPEERNIGRPVSYGCIRMKSADVIDLYNRIGVGAQVEVIRGELKETPEGRKYVKAVNRQREAQEAAAKQAVGQPPAKTEHAKVAAQKMPDEA